jgi:hypothetical protein
MKKADTIWYVIAAVLLLDTVWASLAGIQLASESLVRLPLAVAALAALAVVYRTRASRLAELAGVAQVTVLWSFAAGLLSYLVVTLRAPLQDATYDAIDRSLGLNWLVTYEWVRSHPWVDAILQMAYDSLGLAVIVGMIAMTLVGRVTIVREFQWAVIQSLLIIIPFSALFPAKGPWVYYDLPIKAPWIADVMALRAGEMHFVDYRDITGIIVCPSFHVCLALLFVYAARFSRPWFAFSAIWSGLIILSTPVAGSHYLIDVIAGAAVAAVAILAGVARRGRNNRRNLVGSKAGAGPVEPSLTLVGRGRVAVARLE